MAGELAVIGDWLAQEVCGCTCGGPFDHYGHWPGCGYEPVLKLDDIRKAFRRAGLAVVSIPDIAHKGPHDTDASMLRTAADKAESARYPVGGSNVGRGVAQVLRDVADAAEAL